MTLTASIPPQQVTVPQPPFYANIIYSVPLEAIEADEDWNCRGYIETGDILDLATDIRNNGLQSPVQLTTNLPGRNCPFRLMAGYRRFKAHLLNQAKIIRSTIEPGLDETEARFRNLNENLQRRDLNMKQEAFALKHLQFLPVGTVARRLCRPDGWVRSRLALLQLPPDLQDEAAAGKITSSDVLKCSKLESNELMYAYIRKIKEGRMTGKKREVKVEDLTAKNETRLRSRMEIAEIQDIIRRTFGNGLTTRALAWAGGFIDDAEFRAEIQEQASQIGKFVNFDEV